MAGKPRVTPLVKKRSSPICASRVLPRLEGSCQGSTDEQYVVVCSWSGVWRATSWNAPSFVAVPRYNSRMAYPAQFRGSEEPWESQVLDDSVMRIRTKRIGSGLGARRIVSVPPLPFVILAPAAVCQAPRVGDLMGSSGPVQYCTT